MALTHDQIADLQMSLERLRENLSPDDTRFYDRLFQLEPEFKSLFRDDIAGQGMKFFSTLSTILDALTVPSVFDEEVSELGRLHGAIGIEPRHYAPLGDALFDTFHDILGIDYTKELDATWREAFALIAARMIDASEADRRPS